MRLKRYLAKKIPFLQIIYFRIQCSIYKRKNIGPGSKVDASVHVLGWRNVKIGFNTYLSEHCWLNINNRQSREVQISIEDNCFFGRRNFLSSGALLRIGSYCLTGPDCKFIGSDHVIANPFLPYASTGATVHARMDIGVNCWFGAGTVVLGSVKIGHGSVIGVNAMVNSDIPPFSVVVGTPGRVIRRYKIALGIWASVDDFTESDELALPTESEYLKILQRNMPVPSLPVQACGKSMGDLP